MSRAIVLVLGDLGRSPRMLNHAAALAAHGWDVDLVGYPGAPLPPHVDGHPGIRVHHLGDRAAADSARRGSRLAYVWRAALRAVRLGLQLARLLMFRLARPRVIIVQNPPGIPTLPIAVAAARVRSAELVVDWHNLTSAMLALRTGADHWMARLAAVVERQAGRMAYHNLFVSQAMADALGRRWGLRGVVFRDRPGRAFRPVPPKMRALVRRQLLAHASARGEEEAWLIVISPTSWTADEDFDLLIDAARRIEQRLTSSKPPGLHSRRILILATGRGALKDRFETQVSALRLEQLVVCTAWVEPEHYAEWVGAADVGLSLHRSASGLDLPMKVMDFFGAGVPVCALDYGECLAEAVHAGQNGLVFRDARELAGQLLELAANPDLLLPLAAGAARTGSISWEQAWASEVLPVL